jgi:YD repeat-containing protein
MFWPVEASRRSAGPRIWLVAALILTSATTSRVANALVDGPVPGAITPTTLKRPDGPGSVRGLAEQPTFDVFHGQVTYAVPFDLPKGPAGFGPGLSASYSGDLGNGPLGVGWALSGIAIRRSVRLGVPHYDDTDELEVTGLGTTGRLVLIGAGEFRIEGHPTTVRVLKKSGGFEITDADGTRYLLGYTSEAREEGAGKTSGWLVQWIVHFGQAIEFHYQHDEGRTYLSEIDWGPGKRFQASLDYETRPDPIISFRTGYEVVTAWRLTTLTVTVNGARLQRYTLTYQAPDDQTLSLSRLRSVALTGTDGVTAMPTLALSYAAPEDAKATQVPGLDGWVLNARDTTFADVDGDGMADLLRLETGNHVYRKNVGGSFAAQRALSGAGDVDFGNGQLMDLDGDARPELVHIVDDTWRAYKLDGEQWSFFKEWSGTHLVGFHDAASVLADVNADGRTDVIVGQTGGIGVRLAGDGTLLPKQSLPPIDPANVSVTPGNPDVRFFDVNGDGVVDVVWLADEWLKIYLGRGDGTFLPYKRAFYPWKGVPGADGVFRSADIRVADLNRDGLFDLVVINAANILYFRGLAELGSFATLRRLDRPEGVAFDAVVDITDANGNGSEDVVWSSSRGMWILDLAGGTTAGMLSTIDNGLGAVTRFTYSHSAILSVAAENAGQPWKIKLPVSVAVPIQMEVDTGGDSPKRVTSYNVRDGFWDGTERRFGGFLESHSAISAPSAEDVLFEDKRYHAGLGDERVLRGLVAHQQTSNGLGRRYRTVDVNWVAFKVGNLDNPLLRRAAKESVFTFVEDGGAPIQISSTFEFDSEGRTIVERHSGVDVLGDEKIVERQYDSDPANWIRDRVCLESVRERDGSTLRSERRTSYGSDTEQFAPCSGHLGNGWVREIDTHLVYTPQPGLFNPSDDSLVVDQLSAYDAFGNVIQSYAAGVTREVQYDSDKFHPTSETVHPSANQSLTWQSTWDPLIDQIRTVTDPNADLTSVGYDALGRVSTISLNGASPYAAYSYDWSAPTPRTTTTLIEHAPSSECTPAARQITAVSNGLGETLYKATQASANQWIISGWNERDERGKVVLAAEAFFSPTASPLTRASSARVETFDYDGLGRMSLQTLPTGARTITSYNGLCQTINSDELADVTSCSDGLGRTVHTERTVLGITESLDAEYDAADRINAMVLQRGMPNETTHSFSYDTWGHLRQAHDPDTGYRSLFYDASGFLRQHMNGESKSVYFDYDGAGRLVRRGETETPDPVTDYVYAYDLDSEAAGSGCRVHSRLASVVEQQSGQVHLCYDAFGRQNGIARTITAVTGSRTASQQSTFSPSGLLLSEQFDDGFSTAYCYDQAGRAVSVSSGGAVLWSASNDGDIDAPGRVVSERYGNGATEAYAYDLLGLTKSVDLRSVVNGQVVDLFKIDVTRTTFGAPKTIVDSDGNVNSLNHSATYDYDAAARLTDATLGATSDPQGLYTFSFRYDGLQNMAFRQVMHATQGASPSPVDIGVLTGVYKYGERGYGPRQLTSVIP